MENGSNKPKASVPLKKIVTVNEFSEEDQKKYKKLAKAYDLGIKLVFKKRYLVEKAYVPDDAHELDMSDGEAGSAEDTNEEEEKDRTDPALVRSYELNKLKYYYAVAECDSSETAAAVYAMADGMEFGDSSNFLDLRFVPPGTVLKNAPRDVSQAVPEDYEACVMLSTPPPPPPLAIFCFVPCTRSKLTLPYNPCLTLCPSALSFSRERCSPQR